MTMVRLECARCGVEFDRPLNLHNKNLRRGSNRPYCSRACQSARSVVTDDSKRCTDCGLVKHKDEFWYQHNGLLDRKAQCKQCSVRKRAHRRWYVKNIYGLTLEEADALVARGCALCGTPYEGDADRCRIHIDHDHETGKVRGALCHGCNTGLGSFAHDPERLRAAADYLERHRT